MGPTERIKQLTRNIRPSTYLQIIPYLTIKHVPTVYCREGRPLLYFRVHSCKTQQH